MEEQEPITKEKNKDSNWLYEKNDTSYKVFEKNHNYYAIKVGEVSRLAYPAIIATVYVASGNQVPHVETWNHYTPQHAAVFASFFAVLGAIFDFLQFYVMAWISRGDMNEFEKKIAKNDEYYPPIFPKRFNWSWFLFVLKGFFILLSALSLAVYLFSLSLAAPKTNQTKAAIENFGKVPVASTSSSIARFVC